MATNTTTSTTTSTNAAVATPGPRTAVCKGRIPASLQAIIVQSNCGHEVHQPPQGHVAQRVYSPNTTLSEDDEVGTTNDNGQGECDNMATFATTTSTTTTTNAAAEAESEVRHFLRKIH